MPHCESLPHGIGLWTLGWASHILRRVRRIDVTLTWTTWMHYWVKSVLARFWATFHDRWLDQPDSQKALELMEFDSSLRNSVV
jgi:hypothetical protein